jgi:hypothetical protein
MTMIWVLVFAWLRQNVRIDQITYYAFVSDQFLHVQSKPRSYEPRWRGSTDVREPSLG